MENGTIINQYKIISRIGKRGMGEVYLAEDTRLDRNVAIKFLNEEFSKDADKLKRFIQEAKAASALNHPNILTVYEIGESEGRNYIAAELIEGKTLREHLSANEPLSVNIILKIGIQVSEALSAAHQAGILHRDIKPENIMIRRDGYAKILDFGLAKPTEKKRLEDVSLESETKAFVQTNPGTVMGTVSYISPEQARGKETDTRTDIWSLGVLLYEMVAGKTPFNGETTSDIIASILKSEPPLLSHTVPDIPPELEKIVGKTLRKNADERFQHIKDVQIDLKDLRQDLELQARLERTASPNKESIEKDDKNRETQILEIDKTNDATEAISTKDSVTNHPSSSAEYIAGEIKQHKRGLLAIASIVIIAVAAALGYWFYANRPASNDTNQISSVAVLPFENGTGDAGLDYLSDGLSESLIDKLSQLPQLKVIARTSSFKYRGANIDIQEAANKLGVQALVMGKINRVGDNLSVRVEMIDAAENRQLWSEQYNRQASDLLSIQQDIAQAASEKLRLKLSGAQEEQLVKRGTDNPQAYELFLKGVFYENKGGTENQKKTNDFFQQAVAADPNYALAYAKLARSYGGLAADSIVNPKEYLAKSESAARKALELDENLAEGHLAMASLYRYAWNWTAAEQEYKRVIELNPNLGEAHQAYSFYLGLTGRHDEAIAEAKRARELDPLSLYINVNIGYRLYWARRFDEAIEALQKPRELNPNHDFTYAILGYCYAGKGLYREAIAAYQESIRLGDKSPGTQIYLGAAYAQNGEIEKARTILRELQTTKEYVSPGEIPVLYGALGDKEAAFQSLEKAYAEHDLQLQFLKVDPALDPLRDDPRYQDLMRRVGLQ